jgi:hypothetical protein
MGCWSNGVERAGVTDGDLVVEVLVEAPVVRVERVGTAVVAGVMVVAAVDAAAVRDAAVRGVAVGSVGLAVTAVELVTPPGLLVRGNAHTIPPPIARATSTSGTIRRYSRDRDRVSRPAWRR